MPGNRRVDLIFPLKGLHTDVPRGVQPLEYSTSLSNVWPQDAGGRLRGAQRPGMSKLYASALGSGGIMQSLHQTVFAVDPSAITSSGVEVFHDFLRSYGSGAVNTIAGTVWHATKGGATGATGFKTGVSTTTTTSMKIFNSSQGAFYEDSATADEAYTATYVAAFTLPASYVWKSRLQLDYDNPMVDIDDLNGGTMKIIAGVDITDYTKVAQLITLVFCRNFIAIIEGEPAFGAAPWTNFATNANVTYIKFGTKLAVGIHDVELRISQDATTGKTVAQGWIDSTLWVSRNVNTTRTAAEKYPALGLGSNFTHNDNSHDWIDNIYMMQGTALLSSRNVRLISVANGKVYVGDTTSATMSTGGSNVINTSGATRVQVVSSRGTAYIVDGGQYVKKLDIQRNIVSNLAASAGTAPSYCTLACFWRDRLVLAAPTDAAQNYFVSRQGTHDDFDYGQEDEGAAFAGNASAGHYIGEPLTCLIPHTEDYLLLGGDSQIWRFVGDPRAGGQVQLVTSAIGMTGPNAWCMDPSGVVYFVGTGGLYRIAPGGMPDPISRGRYDAQFTGINRGNALVNMVWDRDNQGCYIFIIPIASGAGSAYWYDARTDGLFPLALQTDHGPLCVLNYDGDGATDRFILLGGREGYIRKFDSTATSDDGSAIVSSCCIGPIHPDMATGVDEMKAWVLNAASVVLGDGVAAFNLNATFQQGSSDYEAINSPASSFTINWTAGARQQNIIRRLYGGSFYVKLANSTLNKSWNLEKISLSFKPGGMRTQ